MCLNEAERFEVKEMKGWRVFRLIRLYDTPEPKLFSPIMSGGPYLPGTIYWARGRRLELDCNYGFHAFTTKLAARLSKFLFWWGSECVIREVILYDVKWRGKYGISPFKTCVTAESMMILPTKEDEKDGNP